MSEEGRIIRRQLQKKGGQTPEFINEIIPTEPLRLRFGPGRGTATAKVGSAWLLGSKYLPGSPFELQYQVMRRSLDTNTLTWWAVVHSRYGTVDTPYTSSKGNPPSHVVSADLTSPIYSFPPGTLKLYALGIGSSVSRGKGSVPTWSGLGSGGLYSVSASLDLYAV